MTWNPQNPFVHSELINANSPQSIVYQQSLIYIAHKVNNYTSAFFGLTFNVVVLYLIARKTPIQFRPYSKMLLMCALSDSYSILSNLVCQSRVRVTNGTIIISFTGPIGYLDYSIQCWGIALQSTSAVFGCLILPFQYFYRYQVVKHPRPPSILQTLLYFIVPSIFTVFVGVFAILGYCPSLDIYGGFDFGPLWYNEVPVPKLVVGSLTNRIVLACVGYCTLVATIAYIISIWLARKTVVALKHQVMHLNNKTRELQSQFSRTLFVQSITPLCTSLIPVVFTVTAAFIQLGIGYSCELIIAIILWFPVLNSLSILIFIVPYRRYCLNILRNNKTQPASIGPSSTSNNRTVMQHNQMG